MNCLESPYRQLYDSFINRCFLGALDVWFLPYESPNDRKSCVTTGYAVNKDTNEILKCRDYFSRFKYQVLDHIRIIEDTISGLYKTENEEFNQISHLFLREFMMGNIYVLYSEEFKDYELALAKRICEENQEDPIDRIERSYPDCNFRLLRRVPAKTEDNDVRWRWDAVLSGVQDIELKEDFLPKVDELVKNPLRFTFNEGQLFMQLYQIFSRYEAQLQIYDQMFTGLHKIGDINGEDITSIQTKEKQFQSPSVFTSTAVNQKESTTTVEDLSLLTHIPTLKETYDNITTRLNDSLGRLGLAGDDSTKAERVTTGENFRALQPNMAFQQAILNRLEIVTERIRKHFQQEVIFIQGLQPNEQGIPITEDVQDDELGKPKEGMNKTTWSK